MKKFKPAAKLLTKQNSKDEKEEPLYKLDIDAELASLSDDEPETMEHTPTLQTDSIISKTSKPSSSNVEATSSETNFTSLRWMDLGLEKWLENHLVNLQMKLPTPIQEKCIPQILNGKNIIAMAQTGTGKTAAFALPIIQTLVKDVFGIFALVVTPTRELANQIKIHFESLAGDFPIRVALLCGGLRHIEMATLMDTRPHIVVGTPLQLVAAAQNFGRDNYFKRIRFLVFDEADRLLKSDKASDISTILKACNPNRQTLLFSATMDDHVKQLAQLSFKKDPSSIFMFDACKLYKTADNLEQYYALIPEAVKDCYLLELLKSVEARRKKAISMVFFSSVEKCELLTIAFRKLGVSCDCLHAAKDQRLRFQVLEDFQNRKISALFLTDVGNRGLDIPSVNYVINYDLPIKTDLYVHRVGRTARAGQFGVAISLVSQHEIKLLQTIEKDIHLEMKEYTLIDEKKAEENMYEIAEERAKAKIAVLENGFIESFAAMKEGREKSKLKTEQARIQFEEEMLAQIRDKKLKSLKKGSSSEEEPKQKEQTKEQETPSLKQKVVGDITLFGASKKKKRTENNESSDAPETKKVKR